MINIQEKVIKFGYGSVLVRVSMGVMHLVHIEPPVEIGIELNKEKMKNVKELDSVTFKFGSDMTDLLRKLDSVNEANPTFEFRGYIFDFGHYNPASVNVVRQGVRNVIAFIQLGLAC